VIIVLCLTLEELLGLEVADLEVVLGITTLLRELVAGFLAVDEDLVLLIGVMTVLLFGVDILEADLVGVATCTDLLIGGE
jgi:hypothetical protein